VKNKYSIDYSGNQLASAGIGGAAEKETSGEKLSRKPQKKRLQR
jgi:hypothetical protein